MKSWLKKILLFPLPKNSNKQNIIVHTKEDLEEFRGKIITENDVDKIIEIVEDCDDYIKEYLHDYSGTSDFIKKASFKDAILNFGYLNYINNLNSDYYGEHSYHNAYFKCCKDYGEDPHNIGSAYFELKMVRIHTIGWDFARKLDLKFETKPEINYKPD